MKVSVCLAKFIQMIHLGVVYTCALQTWDHWRNPFSIMKIDKFGIIFCRNNLTCVFSSDKQEKQGFVLWEENFTHSVLVSCLDDCWNKLYWTCVYVLCNSTYCNWALTKHEITEKAKNKMVGSLWKSCSLVT